MSSRKKAINNFQFIPEDFILSEIISRSSAKDVKKFLFVHRSWNGFLTTQNFKELHLRNGRPFLLVLNITNTYKQRPFLMSEWWDLKHHKPTVQMLTNFPRAPLPYVVDGFSLDGLIVLKESTFVDLQSRDFIIFNPVFSLEVRVRLSQNVIKLSDVYAAFFHPVLKEYYTLWRIVEQSKFNSLKVTFMLLNLGPEPRWRAIHCPLAYNKYALAGIYPIYSNGCIYWEVNGNQVFLKSVMVYEIITEKFVLIPYPDELNNANLFLLNIKFMNIDGHPSLVHIYETHGCSLHVNVWTLHNNSDPFWKRSTYYAVGEEGILSGHFLKPIAVVNGVLALHNGKRIFLCSLLQGTIKVYARERYNNSVDFWSHVVSFIPLNCPSAINMAEAIVN